MNYSAPSFKKYSNLLVTLIFSLILISPPITLGQDLNITNNIFENAPEDIRERNAFKRQRWFYEQRMFPNNFIPRDALLNSQREKRLISSEYGYFTNSTNAINPPATWESVGPTPGFYQDYGNISSRITTIQYDPINPNIIYLGAAFGGVWKSTDGGDSWVAKTDNEVSLSSGSIAIDPTNTNIIYYGTGEATYSGASYYGRGLLKSTDGGENWTNYTSGLPSSSYTSRIVVRPGNSQQLLAAMGTSGLYRSLDGGANWTQLVSGRCDDVVFTPTGDTAYAVGSGTGYVISIDGGGTFTSSSALSLGSRNHIAICKAQPNVLYFSRYSSSSIQVFKSTDHGTTFNQVSSGTDFNGGQAWYDFYMHVNPLDPDFAYVGSIDVWRTTDGGASFQNITDGYGSGYVHVDQHNIAFHPTDPNKMMCVNDGGVWRSDDRGSSWTNLNSTLNLTQFYRIASDPSNANHIMGGTQDNGTQRTQGTINWAAAFGGDGGEVCFHDQNSDNVLGETQNGGLRYSTNNGDSWSYPRGLSGSASWVAPIISHPTTSGVFFQGRERVFKTTNGGARWNAISTGTSGELREMAICKSDPNIMYATSGSNIYKSTNEGVNFTNVTNGLPSYTITSVYVHPDSSDLVFITFSGFGDQHIYKSNDGAATWRDITGNLPNSPTNDLLLLTHIGPLTYCSATDIGVFITEDDGNTWIELAQGLPNTVAMHLDYNALSNEIFIGTHGRGVFKLDASTLTQTTVSMLDAKIFLEGNYSGGLMSSTLKDNSLIPFTQPFGNSPWNYNGTESVTSIPDNIVDWVLIELRTGTEKSSMEKQRACFVKKDGTIVDTDGTSNVSFENLTTDKYYIVVYHRNHILAMSSGLVTFENP